MVHIWKEQYKTHVGLDVICFQHQTEYMQCARHQDCCMSPMYDTKLTYMDQGQGQWNKWKGNPISICTNVMYLLQSLSSGVSFFLQLSTYFFIYICYMDYLMQEMVLRFGSAAESISIYVCRSVWQLNSDSL